MSNTIRDIVTRRNRVSYIRHIIIMFFPRFSIDDYLITIAILESRVVDLANSLFNI